MNEAPTGHSCTHGVLSQWLQIFGTKNAFVISAPVSPSVSAASGLLDFVYFSATVYTTLGFGDLVPTGAVRFLAGTEAVTGFLLISWSASFTFLEMQRFWKQEE